MPYQRKDSASNHHRRPYHSFRAATLFLLTVLIIISGQDYSYALSAGTSGSTLAALSEKGISLISRNAEALTDKNGGKLILQGISDEEAVEQFGYYHGKNAKKIPVITYHRVVSDRQKVTAHPYPSLYVSKSDFTKQMKWLKKHKYRTISCQEFYLWYKGRIRLPEKTVLITFDDSRACLPEYAFPVLKKYGLKATVFTIGHGVKNSGKDSIKKEQLPELQKKYPDIEFQSHTYALHKRFSEKGDYKKTLKDAKKQYKLFGFEYLAYPFGRNTAGMRKAYKKSGIKVAFTYGINDYADRSQSRYQIRRIKIDGNASFSQFTRWFKK